MVICRHFKIYCIKLPKVPKTTETWFERVTNVLKMTKAWFEHVTNALKKIL